MSSTALKIRAKQKAPKTKFSSEEEKVIAGWCVYKDITHEASTTGNFKVC